MISFLHTIWPVLSPSVRKRLSWAAGFSVFLALLDTLGVALMLPLILILESNGSVPHRFAFIARWIGTSDTREIAAVIAAAIMLLFLAKSLLSVLFLRWNARVVLRAETDTVGALFRAYLFAPYSYHLHRNSAEMQYLIQYGAPRVFYDGLVSIVGALSDVAIIVVIAGLLVAVNPWMALSAATFFAFVVFGYQHLIRRNAVRAGQVLGDEMKRGYQVVQQTMVAIKEVQTSHSQDHFARDLVDIRNRMASDRGTLLTYLYLPRYYLESALVIGVAIVAAVVFATDSKNEALATLALFAAAGFRILPSLNRILGAWSNANGAKAALAEMQRDLSQLPARAPEPDVSLLQLPATIEFREAVFSYPGSGTPVLDHLSLAIRPGETVGLVGLSGAGKTTLVDVLLGLLDLEAGDLLIDGKPVREVREQWQRNVGYVAQDAVLFDDTIRSNIALGIEPDAVDEGRLREVVRIAQLEEFVQNLPDGLGTNIGENGARVSGGQKQRVAIARALYHQPSLLILDEATSSLDSKTESQFIDLIGTLRGTLTIIMITHRLSTIRSVDAVYFLKQGVVASSGTFANLMSNDPEFARLVQYASVSDSDIATSPGES